MNLLKQLCKIHAPSGEELAMSQFLLNYIQKNQTAKHSPYLDMDMDMVTRYSHALLVPCSNSSFCLIVPLTDKLIFLIF